MTDARLRGSVLRLRELKTSSDLSEAALALKGSIIVSMAVPKKRGGDGLTIRDFLFGAILGEGSYGRVSGRLPCPLLRCAHLAVVQVIHARLKGADRKDFAVKVMDKALIKRENKVRRLALGLCCVLVRTVTPTAVIVLTQSRRLCEHHHKCCVYCPSSTRALPLPSRLADTPGDDGARRTVPRESSARR